MATKSRRPARRNRALAATRSVRIRRVDRRGATIAERVVGPGEFVDLVEAAAIARVPVAQIHRDVADGDLPARRRGGRVYVTFEALTAYRASRARVLRSLAASERDVEAGRVYGPYATVAEFLDDLHGKKGRAARR